MEWLLNLIPGGGFTAVVAGLIAIFTFIGGLIIKSERAGVNKQKAKEAAYREEELRRIKMAGAAKPVGGVSDDPHNRDNRKRT